MDKILFENFPSTNTPMTAEKLNQMQENMEAVQVPQGGVAGQILAKKTNTDNDVEWIYNDGGITGDTLPIGSFVLFGSDTVPTNWLLCNGQAVSRTEYALLFSIIGTAYGVGDGSTTFNLPDLKGRVAVGKDSTQTEFDVLGETGGEKTHTLTVNEMPSHEHNVIDAGNGAVRPLGYGESTQHTGIVRTDANTNWSDHVFKAGATGESQPHNILQPYITTNYIIKAKQSAGIVATVVDGLNSTSTTDALSANQGRVLNNKFNYSTTEKKIGTWIDGKPLYRRVYNNSSTSDINLSDLNYDYVNIVSSMLTISGYRRNPYYTGSSDYFRVLISGNKRLIAETSGSVQDITNWITVLEYTKTTDVEVVE